MTTWGYDLLQVNLDENFVDNIMLAAYENAVDSKEVLAMYKLVEIFNYYDIDIFKKIKKTVYEEFKLVEKWDNPVKRVSILNEILNNLDRIEENISKEYLNFY